jgi:hypothetical protein
MLRDIKQIRTIVDKERHKHWITSNKSFTHLIDAKVGFPVQMFSSEGKSAFYFVPLQREEFTCGFALVDNNGKVLKIGILGSSPDNKESWIHNSYFLKPPKNMIEEIMVKYSDFELSEPVFSFDYSPSKWAWLVKLIKKSNQIYNIFITPAGWYLKDSKSDHKHYE